MPRSPRLRRSTAFRLVGAAAALAAAVPTSGAFAVKNAAINCHGPTSIVKGPGVWQSFRAPNFDTPSGLTVSQDVAAYAIDASDPDRVAVTNGNSIYYSGNSGCSWQLGLRLDQVPADPAKMPLSGEVSRIVGLYIAPGSHRIYATAEEMDTGSSVGRPHVLFSDNGIAWSLGDNGLPPLGHPLVMKAASTNANVLYLSFQNAKDTTDGTTCPPSPLPCTGGGTGRPLGLLWGSTTAGTTWTSRTDPSDLNGSYPIRFFSIDDDDRTGNTLWVAANGALRRSIDGGRTYGVPDGLDQSNFTITAVESLPKLPVFKGVRLVAFSGEGEMLRLDKNRWIRSRVPFFPVESVGSLPNGQLAVATAPTGGQVTVWRIFAQDFRDFEDKVGLAGKKLRTTWGWEQITPGAELSVAANMTAGADQSADTYFLRDKRRVLRFLTSSIRDKGVFAPPQDIGAPPAPRGRISPSVLTLNLPIGKTKTVDYTMTLPPAPTPIDLFLLIDDSGSMQPLIDDLKASMADVVRALVTSGVDVQAGVGQINVQPETPPLDDPRTPEDESKPKPLYQLLRRIGPVNTDFFRALSQIDGNGGSGDEAQLESLWQAVNGDGLSIIGLPFLTGYSIPPHQQAGFRTGLTSIKVIVHATDEKFSRNISGTTAHNTNAPVAASLRNAGVKQIGLSQGVDEAKKDLAAMAVATGAVAPAGGTDCDGDGRADLNRGEALVCDQNTGLDKTLVNLLKSLNDPQLLTLALHPTLTMRNVTKVTWGIDAKQPTQKTFKVTYSCVGVPAGSYLNSVDAVLRGQVVATAVATVNCGSLPLPRERPDFVPPQPPAQAPAPVTAPVPPLNPVAQTQVQTQVNPQAGMAEQEQNEFQLAAADNDITEPGMDDELAMSKADRWNGALVPYGVGLTMAAGAAVGLRRRTRTSLARARVR